MAAGYASGIRLRESSNDGLADTGFAAFVGGWGISVSDPLASERWYRGNVEVLFEGALLHETTPEEGSGAGGALLLRYNFLGRGRLVPFVEVGGGAVGLDFDREAAGQSDGFNFTLQGGFGAHWFWKESLALTASWRLHHISNGRIESPNDGIDSSLFLLGVSFF